MQVVPRLHRRSYETVAVVLGVLPWDNSVRRKVRQGKPLGTVLALVLQKRDLNDIGSFRESVSVNSHKVFGWKLKKRPSASSASFLS